jgi:hypothetical protein
MRTRVQFSDRVAAVKPATAQGGDELLVRIPKGTASSRYAAMVSLPPEGSAEEDLVLSGLIKVSGGNAQIGILSEDETRFLIIQTVAETSEFVPIRLRPNLGSARAGRLVVAAGGLTLQDVTVQLHAAELTSIARMATRTYASGLAVPPSSMLQLPAGAR